MGKPGTIGVFTSGGDSPGMNACIRAVVRTGIYRGIKVKGIMRGYEGMIDGEIIDMESGSVSNIIQRGGTILKSARSQRFRTPEGMAQAYENLQKAGIEGVVAIGGDGTFRGAKEFNSHYSIPFVGVPGTIDNDLFGTDFTLGYDTAINTAVRAIDKIRDTASSHNRLFFVEVMGRDAGFIALRSGIGAGAECILVPETETSLESVINTLEKGWGRQKSSSIIVVAEGDEAGNAFEIAEKVTARLPHFDTRVSILGHIQRGGSPSCMDRVLASELGMAAVEALIDGRSNVMVGKVHKEIKYVPFDQATKHHNQISPNMLKLVEILSV
ncbi:MAG: 6-phosphofructokinase [Bacteroidia bacterium]|nr:6-phosphofructokinase [Bacteroidia bacterium]